MRGDAEDTEVWWDKLKINKKNPSRTNSYSTYHKNHFHWSKNQSGLDTISQNIKEGKLNIE